MKETKGLSEEFIKRAALAAGLIYRNHPSIFGDVYRKLGNISFRPFKSGIAAISKKGVIYLNESYFENKDSKEQKYDMQKLEIIIAHEFLHHVFKHFLRADRVDKEISKDEYKAQLWNIATDAVINELLIRLYGKKAEQIFEELKAVTFKTINEMLSSAGCNKKVEDGLFPEEIYKLLLDHNIKIPPTFNDWHNEESDEVREEEGPLDDMDEETAKKVVKNIRERIKELREKQGKEQGQGTDSLDIFLNRILAEGEVIKDVNKVFEQALVRKIKLVKSSRWTRVNMANVQRNFQLRGYHIPEFDQRLSVEENPFVIVAIIDTSGSMEPDTISELLSSMDKSLKQYAHLVEEITDGEEPQIAILLLEVDAELKNKTLFKSFDEFSSALRQLAEGKRSLKGGGGTDMVPGLRHVEELKAQVDMVFVLTDGYFDNTQEIKDICENIYRKHSVPVSFIVSKDGTTRFLLELAPLKSVIISQLQGSAKTSPHRKFQR